MKRMGIAVLAVSVIACATVKSKLGGGSDAQVSDADLGRLTPSQMGPVNQARNQVSQAEDRVARAKLMQQQAQHEKTLAEAGQSSAKAAKTQAEAQQKIASDNREPAQASRAQDLEQRAQLQQQVADGHTNFADKLVDERNAQVQVANADLDLAKAQLEQSKLQALEKAGVPAASKYNAGSFTERVRNAQQNLASSQQKAARARTDAVAAYNTWNAYKQQFQARSGGTTQGG